MEVKGNIKKVLETVQISEKFAKRELVVTTNDMYPQDIIIQFTQDKCKVLDAYKGGDNVTVSINLRGREWVSPKGEVRYFNTVEGWRIEKHEISGDTLKTDTPKPTATAEADDLPF